MSKPNKKKASVEEETINDDLRSSLELLIERDNPMADAAENALEIL